MPVRARLAVCCAWCASLCHRSRRVGLSPSPLVKPPPLKIPGSLVCPRGEQGKKQEQPGGGLHACARALGCCVALCCCWCPGVAALLGHVHGMSSWGGVLLASLGPGAVRRVPGARECGSQVPSCPKPSLRCVEGVSRFCLHGCWGWCAGGGGCVVLRCPSSCTGCPRPASARHRLPPLLGVGARACALASGGVVPLEGPGPSFGGAPERGFKAPRLQICVGVRVWGVGACGVWGASEQGGGGAAAHCDVASL